MKRRRQIRCARRAESGYALILIMFFLAMLILLMTEAAPTVLSSIQREKETEMVWRGKQYTRGVRMYYLKMNRFPTSLDDLTKPKTGIRFMRQAYKDPMNQVDGSWRLIYVGPNGQLIGSLNDRTISISGVGSPMAGAQGAGALLSSGNSTSLTSFGANSQNSSGSWHDPSAGTNPNGAMGTALANGTVPANSRVMPMTRPIRILPSPTLSPGPWTPATPSAATSSASAAKSTKPRSWSTRRPRITENLNSSGILRRTPPSAVLPPGIGNQNGVNPATATARIRWATECRTRLSLQEAVLDKLQPRIQIKTASIPNRLCKPRPQAKSRSARPSGRVILATSAVL